MTGKELIKVANSLIKILIENGYSKSNGVAILIRVGKLLEDINNDRQGT